MTGPLSGGDLEADAARMGNVVGVEKSQVAKKNS